MCFARLDCNRAHIVVQPRVVVLLLCFVRCLHVGEKEEYQLDVLMCWSYGGLIAEIQLISNSWIISLV